MAWSTITDAVLQVGAPIRALTLRLLRDNITALANGDVGAPRIQNAALPDLVITSNKIGVGQVASWNLAGGLNERNWVLALYAALDAGAVGTLALAQRVATPGISQSVIFGSTYAGSDLRVAGFQIASGVVTMGASGFLSGTWRALGQTSTTVENKITLFVRIA